MKESSWKECIENNSIRKISINKEKMFSLLETADDRIRFIDEKNMNHDNAVFVFEGYYSSMLEVLHAYVISQGYKVKNHICLGFYIRDVLGKDRCYRIFDDCRQKRNSLVYYGQKTDFYTTKASIKKCKILIIEIRKMIRSG